MENIKNKIKYIPIVLLAIFLFAPTNNSYAIQCWTDAGGPYWMNCDHPDNENDNDDDDDDDNNQNEEVVTLSATSIDEDSARLRGEVTDGNNVDVWFVLSRYDSTPSCGDDDIRYSVSGDYDDGDEFGRTVSGLSDDEEYYFRACSDDDSGNIRSFVTDEDDSDNDDDDDNNNDNDNNNNNGDGSIITTDATGVTTTSAILNGVVVNDGGNQRVWFEYGSTTNLGNTTSSKTVSGDESLVSIQLNGLNSSKAYFFRLVSDNGERGDIRSFVTKSTSSTSTTPSNTGNTNTEKTDKPTVVVNSGEYLNIDLIPSSSEANAGDTIFFEAVYENLTNTTLKDVRLNVDFAEGITPKKSSIGTFTSRQNIEVLIPTLSAKTKGSFTIEALIDRNVSDGEFLVNIIEANYDHPVTENTTINTIDYSIIKVFSGSKDQSASALFALGIFPLGFIGWFIIVLIITIIIIVARKIYKDNEFKKETIKIVQK